MDAFIVILLYLDAVNLAEFILFGVDKRRAINGGQRIPEAVLMGFTLAGGGVGAVGGMLAFRHKTRKPRFTVGVPAILITELLFFLGVIWAASL